MTTYTKFVVGDINRDKLQEDTSDAGLPVPGTLYAGFDSGPRIYTRFTETRVISSITDASGTTNFTADPGELRFTFDPDLTPAEEATLDAVLLAHDPLTLSIEQEREDKDAAIIDQITTNLKKDNWVALSAADRQETIRRGLQLLFRTNHFFDLDTDD